MSDPLSMTGFGRGEFSDANIKWVFELRTVNHRYCDINIKMPRDYMMLEERIKKEVSKYHSRGRIDVYLSVTGELLESPRLKVNIPLAREYYECLEKIKGEFSVAGEPDLSLITSYRDIITTQEEEDSIDVDEIWPGVQKALLKAIMSCRDMRVTEGKTLKGDLLDRVKRFRKTVENIEKSVPDLVQERENSLKIRLDNLLEGVGLDPVRLAQEVAIIADKTDVTEELVRLYSHIDQFHDFLELSEPTGRRLDFLLQEFLREINTIGSKINNADTAHFVVDLKNELEKIREQVQNLE